MAPIDTSCLTLYIGTHDNFRSIFSRFRDIASFIHRIPEATFFPVPHFYFGKIWGVPFGIDQLRWRRPKVRTPRLISRKLFSKYSNLCDLVITIPQRYRRTDGQTDRRHAVPRSAYHRAVKIDAAWLKSLVHRLYVVRMRCLYRRL